MVVLNMKLQQWNNAVELFGKLLHQLQIAKVAKNQSGKTLNKLLNAAEKCNHVQFLAQMYATVFHIVTMQQNERFWFATMLRYAQLHLKMKQYYKIPPVCFNYARHQCV